MDKPERPAREFTRIEGLAMCLSMIGCQLSSEVMNQWGMYFYSPSEGVGRTIYVPIALVGVIFLVATVWDGITDPLIGFLSDKTRTRPGRWRLVPIRGRRRPFIFWGSIFMTVPAVAFWYPPVDSTSNLNLVYGTALLCIHWLMFTITVVPLISLGPEIARSERARVYLGTWTAVGMIVGLTIAAVLPGVLIQVLDPARDADTVSAVGYRRVAVLFAIASLVLFQLPVWLIRERYDSEAPARKPAPWKEQFLAVATNVRFIVYSLSFLMFTTGFLAAQRALPYWAELGLGGTEETVTYLMLPFIFTAILSLVAIPRLEQRVGMKVMMLIAFFIIASGLPQMYIVGKADVSTETKIVLGGLLFAYCGIGQGILYVMMTPMLGQIIDHDERRSGVRRESLYNGLFGFVWKAAMGGAILVSSQSMALWGNSAENSAGVLIVGPIAGVFGVVGFFVMLCYPKPGRPGRTSP